MTTKMKTFIQLLSISSLFLVTACNKKEVATPEVALSTTKNQVLKTTKGWEVYNLGKGLEHYQFPSQYVEEFDSYQNVNVLALHPDNSEYEVQFIDITPEDSISSAMMKIPNAVFGINGTYYEKSINSGNSSSYFRTNGVLIDSVETAPGGRLYWKHEGAFYMNKDEAGIVRGDNKIYNQERYSNIMSGSPLLIENYHPSGVHYVRNHLGSIDSLNYEHPDRHQGVRHPRTAVAILEGDILLFITVDGRSEKAAGMSAKELTEFLVKHFEPKDALNLDGGGSTTFWLKDQIGNTSSTGVINYPTDNRSFDHYGQRRIRNGFVIIKK